MFPLSISKKIGRNSTETSELSHEQSMLTRLPSEEMIEFERRKNIVRASSKSKVKMAKSSQMTRSKTFLKRSFLAKQLAASLHQALGTRRDKEIAYQLKKDDILGFDCGPCSGQAQ